MCVEPSVQQLTTPGKGKNTLVLLEIAAVLGRYGKYCGGNVTFKHTQADDGEILTYSQALEHVKHLTLDQWCEARGM